MLRRFLARVGLITVREWNEATANLIASRDRIRAERDALRAENDNLKRAAADRLRDEGNRLDVIDDLKRATHLPNTADDPPPFGHTWGRPDPRSGTGPISVISGPAYTAAAPAPPTSYKGSTRG